MIHRLVRTLLAFLLAAATSLALAQAASYASRPIRIVVPYPAGGAPAMADLLGGRVSMLFESVGTAHQHLKGGKTRAIAVTSSARNPSLPDVPTMAESGVPGYASVPWYTISTAKGVPAEIVQKLNAEINVALKSPDLAQRWEKLGVLPLGGSPEDAAQRNRIEHERWSRVIESAELKAN